MSAAGEAKAVRDRELVTPIPKSTRLWVCIGDDPDCSKAKPCRRCLGKRSRRRGMDKQRTARKALEALSATDAAKFMGQLGNEESWTGLPLRVEVKSGAQCGPIWTKYAAAEAQSEAARPIGDPKPFVMVAMGTRTSDGLVLVRLSQLGRLVEALVNL
jgi:hypothetical protein